MDDAAETPKGGAPKRTSQCIKGVIKGDQLMLKRMVESAHSVPKRIKASQKCIILTRGDKSNHAGPPWETPRAAVGLGFATSHRNKAKSDAKNIPTMKLFSQYSFGESLFCRICITLVT